MKILKFSIIFVDEPPHIRDHREHVAAVEEKRRQLRERHHGADFLFLAPTTSGMSTIKPEENERLLGISKIFIKYYTHLMS